MMDTYDVVFGLITATVIATINVAAFGGNFLLSFVLAFIGFTIGRLIVNRGK